MNPCGPVSLEVAGRQVTVTHPDKVVFPGHDGSGRLHQARPGPLLPGRRRRGAARRGRPADDPEALRQGHRARGRVPEARAGRNGPTGSTSPNCATRRGTSAKEAVIHDAAGLAWAINLGCVDLNPHPVLADDLDHPDELRVDLDPMPGVSWQRIVDVALVAREVLEDYGLVAWPKTSGSRGFHIYARIAPRWSFRQVRLAAQTVAREVERRVARCGDQPLVEGRTRGGVRRLQPERQGPHRRVGLFGAGHPGRAGVDAAALGRGRRLRPRRRSPSPPCPAGSPSIGDPWAGMDDARSAISTGC